MYIRRIQIIILISLYSMDCTFIRVRVKVGFGPFLYVPSAEKALPLNRHTHAHTHRLRQKEVAKEVDHNTDGEHSTTGILCTDRVKKGKPCQFKVTRR